MEFICQFVLVGLRSFYSSMLQLSVNISTFEHKYNNIISDVIFDTRSNEEWVIIFIKRIEGKMLKLPIKRGYKISIEGNEVYTKFREYFLISGEKGQFSIKEFMTNLNNQIPDLYLIADDKRRVILKYDNLDNGSEGIYPIGITNWELVHLKNINLPDDIYHRSTNNLKKTKELYPEIYMATKNMDITIIYGTEPNVNTDKYKKGII